MGCANQADRQRARWPEHRKIEEDRITKLEDTVKILNERIQALELASSKPAPPPAPPPP